MVHFGLTGPPDTGHRGLHGTRHTSLAASPPFEVHSVNAQHQLVLMIHDDFMMISYDLSKGMSRVGLLPIDFPIQRLSHIVLEARTSEPIPRITLRPPRNGISEPKVLWPT